jgi:hypothetical protein
LQGAARAAAERPGVRGRIKSVIQHLIDQGCGRRTPTPPPVYANKLNDSSMSPPFVYDNENMQSQPGGTNLKNSNPPVEFPEISQRAGVSGTNHPDPFARRAQIYSRDEDEDPPPRSVWPPFPSIRKRRNPFILDEAEKEGGAEACSENEEEEEDGTYDIFYVDDDIFD